MIPWLDPDQAPYFPKTEDAMTDPNGLLAAGGKLTVDWLLVAYRQGIFPWFNHNDPILWWSPAPRTVLFPQGFHTSRSLARLNKQGRYRITRNREFEVVIRNCALPRKQQKDTWIIDPMIEAYIAFHRAGYAHSFECRDEDDNLVGGVYGVAIDRVFFGESMYSDVSNASKLCLKHIIECGSFDMLDCQLSSSHLSSLGAVEISRKQFEELLNRLID